MMNNYNLYVDFSPQEAWNSPSMWLEMSLGAIGGGLFIISALLSFDLGIFLGFLILMAGKGIFLLIDLGKPERFLKVLSRPFKSWISTSAWVLLLFGLSGVTYCALLLVNGGVGSGILGVFKVISILLAIFLVTYDGFLLAASKGIEAWNTSILPILYGISSLLVGTGITLALIQEVTDLILLQINIILLITFAFLVFSYISVLKKSTIGARKSAQLLIENYKNPLWIGLVGIGIVLPLLLAGLGLLGLVSLSSTLIIWIALFEVIGAFYLRYLILNIGVYAPV
ncbi:MAG TPA: NrfD/PsrC family molybdoenzyme membrane anchor subunit, partial [Syntrophomonadaceae bacterium]|nr:NrfD/PsrC family molybdoenzyme membrane anchor subunit [Syntrophomonadaceae bacterium]